MNANDSLVHRTELLLRANASRNGHSSNLLPYAQNVNPNSGLPSQPLTVLNLLHCLRRRWKRAISWGILFGVLAAFAIAVFLPPARPSAFSKVYFPPNPNRPLFGNQEIPLNAQTQKELLLSSKVLDQVLKQPEIAELPSIREKPSPKQWLARELHIDFPTGSEIMRITLYGDRSDDLVTIVDAVTLTYLSVVGNDSSTQRQKQLTHYEELFLKAKGDYDRLYEDMLKKGQTVGTTDAKTIAAQIQLVSDQLKAKRSETIVLAKRQEELKRDLEVARKKSSEPIDPKEPIFETLLATDPEVVAINLERRAIEKKRDADLPFLDKDHPDRKRYQTNLARLQAQLDARIAELRPTIEGRVRDRFKTDLEKLEQESSRSLTQLRTVKEEVTQLEGESSRLNAAVANVEGKRPELLDKETEVNRYKNALQRLKNEFDSPFSGEVLEAGTLIVPNETTRRLRFAAIGFVMAFGFVILSLAFWEYRAHRIASPEEVTRHLGLSVMGTVPHHEPLPLRQNRASKEEVNWEQLINESVDSTRTLLLHTADIQGLRRILITSAVGNEGKTSLSQELARSLARAGRRVILIDGDLRAPSLHTLFQVPLHDGVCEYLRGEADVHSLVRPTQTQNLWLIPAGACESRAIQRLAMDGFQQLLEELNPLADFILIDSSPILPVADALQMARHVDGVLVSLMCDVSQMESIEAATHRLRTIGAHVIGAVVNGTTQEAYGYANVSNA